MLAKHLENNLMCVFDLEGIHNSFELLNDLKECTEGEEYLELNGKIIKKAYELGYKKECYFFVKEMDLKNIKNLKLKSCLTYIFMKTSILTKNITHKDLNDIVHNLNPNLYHIKYKKSLIICSSLILKKNGYIHKSISLLEKYDYLNNYPSALLQLSSNYNFLNYFDKEIQIYEILEKNEEQWIQNIIFFRKAKIFIKIKNKNKLRILITGIDIYILLKPIKYRKKRFIELYKIFFFLGDIPKANFFLGEAKKCI